MARVVAIVSDLMLASRVSTALEAAGHEVERTASVPDEVDGADLVVADLDVAAPEAVAGLGVPVLGFYQHTDVDTRRRADEAGIALAVPRSRMVRELPDLAARLLAD